MMDITYSYSNSFYRWNAYTAEVLKCENL